VLLGLQGRPDLLVLHVQPDQLDLLRPLAGGPVFPSGDGFHSRMNPLSLTDGVGHKFAKARHLQAWCDGSNKFRAFCVEYRTKIRKKWRTAATREDKRDLFSELEVACLLCGLENEVEYEKYGASSARSPDLTILSSGEIVANFEVCRIRETSRMSDFWRWQDMVEERVKQLDLPIYVQLDWDDLRDPMDVFDGLRETFDGALEGIMSGVRTLANDIFPGQERACPLAGLDGVMSVTVIGKGEPTATASYLPGIFPVIYTHKEDRKFGDVMLAKLGQMRPGEPNAIVVHITSTTHEEIDVIDGIRNLINAPGTFFEQRGEVRNRSDFIDKLRHLSAVVVRSVWTNQKKPLSR